MNYTLTIYQYNLIKMKKTLLIISSAILLMLSCNTSKNKTNSEVQYSSNPVLDGWYADPEGIIYGDKYWDIPTY